MADCDFRNLKTSKRGLLQEFKTLPVILCYGALPAQLCVGCWQSDVLTLRKVQRGLNFAVGEL